MIDLLKKWLSGDANRSDERTLHQAATNDPFLQDALDGYALFSESNHSAKLQQLNQQLPANTSFDHHNTWRRLAAAAAVVGLISATAWWSQSSLTSDQLAEEVIAEKMKNTREKEEKKVRETRPAAEPVLPPDANIIVENIPQISPATTPKTDIKEKESEMASPVLKETLANTEAIEEERPPVDKTDSDAGVLADINMAEEKPAAAGKMADVVPPAPASAMRSRVAAASAPELPHLKAATPEHGIPAFDRYIAQELNDLAINPTMTYELEIIFQIDSSGRPYQFIPSQSDSLNLTPALINWLQKGPDWTPPNSKGSYLLKIPMSKRE